MNGGNEMTREELGQLILSSERQLYATAKAILHNDQDCADAIQESIVKAFSKVHTLKKDCYAKTWLIRILINECYNITRQDGMKGYLEENYMEDFKIKEIAQILDISEGAVQKRLARAREKLKNTIDLGGIFV